MNRQAGVATVPNNYFHQQQHLHHPHLQHSHPHPHPHPHPHSHSHLQHSQHYHDPALNPGLAYRQLQLPLQQPHSSLRQQSVSVSAPGPAEQLHHQQQQQLSLGPGYQLSDFRHHQPSPLPHRARHQVRQDHQHTMAYDGSHQISDDELAQLQRASESYEAPVTGPLVGQRQPSTAITTEYASADPVYQAKTQSLPQKYSEYRTVRGDGKCGWRAVAFGYFEALIRHGDYNKFLFEEARGKSLHGCLNQAGFSEMMYEDFTDTHYDLLREIGTAVNNGMDADALLLEKFNDEGVQNYAITYMKMITSAWMQTHESEYAPWLVGQSVADYCKDHIDPVGGEMDHVGLNALRDVLISPAGITLEVLYLDRSEGSEVTMHRYDPVNVHIGNIRLLYRPGHYDLLYKQEDLPAPPPAAVYQTYLQHGLSYYEPAADLNVSGMPDFMTLLPGMSYANQSQFCGMPSSYASSSEFSFDPPSQVSACTPVVPTPPAPAPQPHVQSQPAYVPSSAPTQMVPPPNQLSHDMVIRTVPQSQLSHHSEFQPQLDGGPFRPSAWQLEPDFVSATSQMPFQTSIFRNSHFNQAHFLNPDFQPEQWDPEGEYATASSGGKSSRHKNNGCHYTL